MDTSFVNFDALLRQKLSDSLTEDASQDLVSAYESSKSKLRRQVFEEIRAVEPDLTDHGPRHVENVLQNVLRLVPPGVDGGLAPMELYFLGMITLFHDAGNILGRGNHRDKVGRVYDRIRGPDASHLHERTLLLRATRAHTGRAADGSYDTLQELQPSDHLQGEAIRFRELAAVLRLADELAEGPQRTSDFRQAEGLYAGGSRPFHDYASSTHILIDREGHRIAIAHEIQVPQGVCEPTGQSELRAVIDFIYQRIVKTNQERQYARYYSDLLAPFRRLEVTFNFHYGTGLLDMDIAPLLLTDIVVPGDDAKAISAVDPAYALESLIQRVTERCSESSANGNT